MHHGYNEKPVNPLPTVVWILVAPMIVTEIIFALANTGVMGTSAIGWRYEILGQLGFDPEGFRRMIAVQDWSVRPLATLISYAFVHTSLTHAAFVVVFTLAIGKFVGEVFAGWAVAAVFLGASILGGLVYALMPFTSGFLIGGYPGAYGLIGAFTWLLWMKLGPGDPNRMRAFSLIGMLAGLQLVFGALFGARPDWIAQFAGFGVGFLLSFIVAPGGWRHLLRKLRKR
ncbi:membrane associated rhomboid family serine protease [Rhodobacter aestuarii]|uniref:Membrane associated serine protease, rhomboid family n=1 Tax=Rhodobacter aestuarii TaxID=453582 RepID=A0A1N7NCU7_9RHOB|nr:rhomboid family intramembrane serine protease [Rhodobacter aestuarii]PTV96379.1 membrane associated rhomboid family serine protease [Rhodobacter aestuarii]SIS96061.1 Membrane associated serine protease, rhomboid family [Rhodobacter aestuarii]